MNCLLVLILALFISAPFHSDTLLAVIENKTTCIVLDEETPLGEGDVDVHVGAVQEAADAQAAQGRRKLSSADTSIFCQVLSF